VTYPIFFASETRASSGKQPDGFIDFCGSTFFSVKSIWDRYFRFPSAGFLGLSEWICPHCFTNLSMEESQMTCLYGCHHKPHPKRVNDDNQ